MAFISYRNELLHSRILWKNFNVRKIFIRKRESYDSPKEMSQKIYPSIQKYKYIFSKRSKYTEYVKQHFDF